MKTLTKIAILAVLCGVVIFFPNNFAKASQIKKEPVDYSIIKSATEEEMDPKIYAAITKAALDHFENNNVNGTKIKPTLMKYKGINYILSDRYGFNIFPTLKLDPTASVVNLNNYYKDSALLLNKDGIYLFYDGDLIHIRDSYRDGFSIVVDTKDSLLIFKDKKRTYQFFSLSPNNFSTIQLAGNLTTHDDDDSTTTPIYYTDDKYVYYVDRDAMDANAGLAVIPSADPKTFQLGLDPKTFGDDYSAKEFFRDKRYLYSGMYSGIKRIKKADPNTARMAEIFIGDIGRFSTRVVIDKKHLFHYDSYSGLKEIHRLNIGKLETITLGENSEFLVNAFLDKKHGKVYSIDFNKEKAYKIPGADPFSFEVSTFDSGNAYFHDKSSVYVLTSSLLLAPVPRADIKTFELICNRNSIYRDKNNVYYIRENDVATLEAADAKYFKVLEKSYCALAVDKDHVFKYDSEKKKYAVRDDLDAATFQYIERSDGLAYMYDKNGVYLNAIDYTGKNYVVEKRVQLDPKTFKENIGNYAIGNDKPHDFLYLYDDNEVWFTEEGLYGGIFIKVEGADPKTFDFTKPPPDL